MLFLHAVGLSSWSQPLYKTAVPKSVMFEETTISQNADTSKDKRSIYRYHKLSNEDKLILYMNRPDLDPDDKMREPLLDQSSEYDEKSRTQDSSILSSILKNNSSSSSNSTGINSPSSPRQEMPVRIIDIRHPITSNDATISITTNTKTADELNISVAEESTSRESLDYYSSDDDEDDEDVELNRPIDISI